MFIRSRYFCFGQGQWVDSFPYPRLPVKIHAHILAHQVKSSFLIKILFINNYYKVSFRVRLPLCNDKLDHLANK